MDELNLKYIEEIRKLNRRLTGPRFQDPDIRAIRQDSRTLDLIAKEYGCSLATISNIKNRVTYAHVVDSGPVRKNRVGRPQKLTEDEIFEIRMSSGTCRELAEQYGVSESSIYSVKHGPGTLPPQVVARVDGKPIEKPEKLRHIWVGGKRVDL